MITGGIFLLVSQVLLAVFTAPPSAETLPQTEPDFLAAGGKASAEDEGETDLFAYADLPPVEYREVVEGHPFY